MNNPKSFWLGWGSLIVAGGGAYYFAKKEINASRREAYMRLQQKQYENSMMYIPDNQDTAAKPSSEATSDPAPTRHEPKNDEERMREKSKYEASAVYRSPKGDRFS